MCGGGDGGGSGDEDEDDVDYVNDCRSVERSVSMHKSCLQWSDAVKKIQQK